MLKTRNRIINFRVTEDEFARLRDASVENGARCLSDFARTAILIGLESGRHPTPGDGAGKDQLKPLLLRIGTLERNIAKLERMISMHTSNERPAMSLGASV